MTPGGERKHFFSPERIASAIAILAVAWAVLGWFNGDHSVSKRIDDTNDSVSKIDRRVVDLEHSDKDQEAHFARIESSFAQYQASSDRQFDNTTRTLGDINKKLDDMHDQLLLGATAGARPDTRRWAK